MKKIAIFASGSGSNAENIIKHFSGNKDVEFPFILCNNEGAYVHERAKKLGVKSYTFGKSELADGSILKRLQDAKIDLVVLAGFMLKMPDEFVEAFPHRMVNIHPALLPKYGGKGMYGHHVHEAVVAAHETESGVTIHYVDNQYDHGQIILQDKCKVLPTDTPEMVAEKVHELEYINYPKAIEIVLNNMD